MVVTVCSEGGGGGERIGRCSLGGVFVGACLCSLLPLPALPAKWEKIQFPSRRATARSSPPDAE